MLKKINVIFIIIILINNFLLSQNNIILEPKGIYAEIDIKKETEAITILTSNNIKEKQKIIEVVLKNPNIYNPTVFYILSNILFNNGKQEEGSFWFYVAQLRARYDANRCADETARELVSILNNEYGPIINKYTLKNINLLKKIVDDVIVFVRNNNEEYDYRWINLHGMDALSSSLDANDENNEKKGNNIKSATRGLAKN